ncbi:hypothetical protein DVH05_022913 [Phytophthora capsici]|nr:hypothetical protein DVH05_022913 [Phytophthora capsici]
MAILEIVMGRARRLRGQAWVTFNDIPSASNALRSVNGSTLFDKPVAIHFAKEKADVIARREGTFVPREKRKREPKQTPVQTAKKQAGENGKAAPASRAPPAPAQNVPNKILFLQELPESCNQEMLSVLFKQYQGFNKVSSVLSSQTSSRSSSRRSMLTIGYKPEANQNIVTCFLSKSHAVLSRIPIATAASPSPQPNMLQTHRNHFHCFPLWTGAPLNSPYLQSPTSMKRIVLPAPPSLSMLSPAERLISSRDGSRLACMSSGNSSKLLPARLEMR